MGKRILFVIIFLLILTNGINYISAESCIESLSVQIGVYEKYQKEGGRDNFYQRSKYQINTRDGFVREGDYLFIERLDVVISPKCNKELEDIYIKTKSPSQDWFKHHMGGNLRIGGKSNFTYSIWHKSPWEGRKAGYEDSFGNSLGDFSGFQQLNEEGVWEMGIFDSSSDDSNITKDSFYFHNENSRVIGGEIEVLDRVSVTQLETLRQIQSESNSSSRRSFWITLGTGIISIFVVVYIGYKQIGKMKEQIIIMKETSDKQIEIDEKREEAKQIGLLRILYVELIFLEKNLSSYKETFSKDKHYPFYELWNIDVSSYLKTLNHKIKGKETIELKENLMTLKDKLLIINNMKFESKKDEEERGGEKLIQVKIESIRKGIINIIEEDLLPIIERTKKFLKNDFGFKDE